MVAAVVIAAVAWSLAKSGWWGRVLLTLGCLYSYGEPGMWLGSVVGTIASIASAWEWFQNRRRSWTES